MNLRKINRVIHRDLGYFFTGMIIIYTVSGIALNHRNDWNPNYSITTRTLTIDEAFMNDNGIWTITGGVS